jgi:hypothetical protein
MTTGVTYIIQFDKFDTEILLFKFCNRVTSPGASL